MRLIVMYATDAGELIYPLRQSARDSSQVFFDGARSHQGPQDFRQRFDGERRLGGASPVDTARFRQSRQKDDERCPLSLAEWSLVASVLDGPAEKPLNCRHQHYDHVVCWKSAAG